MSDRLIRLRDFMGKTMKASEAAKANGDQDGIDRYGDFLDRAGVVAEREMSGGGPQDIGFTPQDTGGGQMPGQLAPPPELPTGKAADVLSQERDLEANPFAPKQTEGTPLSEIDKQISEAEVIGKRIAPKKTFAQKLFGLDPQMTKDTVIPDLTGVGNYTPGGRPGPHDGDINTFLEDLGHPGFKGEGEAKRMANIDTQISEAEEIGRRIAPPFTDEGLGEVDQMPQSEINLSMEDEVANAKAGGEQPDKVVNDVAKFATDAKEAEVARRIQKYLGEKPEFFSWENIIMMLLIGAPRAYQSYVSKKRDYQKGVLGIEQDVENKVARQDENQVREDRLNRQSEMDYYKTQALVTGKSQDRNVRAAIAMLNKAGSGMTSMAQATMGQDLEKNDEYQAWKRQYETAKQALEALTAGETQ